MSIEFYVILSVIAACVVAALALPRRHQAVRTFFYNGTLHSADQESQPQVRFTVRPDSTLEIERTGLSEVRMDGSCNFAVKISDFDVVIEERITPGYIEPQAGTATVVIDCLGPERYHFQYRSVKTGRTAALTLNLRPGNTLTRPLEI